MNNFLMDLVLIGIAFAIGITGLTKAFLRDYKLISKIETKGN
mgnify:FL=1